MRVATKANPSKGGDAKLRGSRSLRTDAPGMPVGLPNEPKGGVYAIQPAESRLRARGNPGGDARPGVSSRAVGADSERLLRGLCRWCTRTGPRAHLPHLTALNQLIRGRPELIFAPAAGHSQVVGPRLSGHRAEQRSLDALGGSGALLEPRPPAQRRSRAGPARQSSLLPDRDTPHSGCYRPARPGAARPQVPQHVRYPAGGRSLGGSGGCLGRRWCCPGSRARYPRQRRYPGWPAGCPLPPAP